MARKVNKQSSSPEMNNHSKPEVRINGYQRVPPLPIVGIGASAGGFEALEQFFRSVPEGSNIAFIVVQHLDPTREDSMPELLNRITTLDVVQAREQEEIKPNTAYIIPPNKTMSVFKGRLYLFEPTEPRGLRFPIDFFLRSLSEDQLQSSIAIILSGMGTDGTLGVQSIREKSGLVMVQSPETAKFSGMPRSVVEAGLADIVAPVHELPELIISHLNRIRENGFKQAPAKKEKSAIEKIILLLRLRTGNDFSMYKKTTIYRRIERRMNIHGIQKIDAYVKYLQENTAELDILYREIFIGVTSFFRDINQWDLIKDKVIPEILSRKPDGTVLRAWVAGCSSGEEAYSLAIIFKEALETLKTRGNCVMQIFATDIDNEAINKARKGIFPINITNDVSAERLGRFFERMENTFRINPEIREMVVFAPQNIIMHPPFTKIDILTCRNLLIYLDSEVQRKLIQMFHYSLNPGGCLMLGNSETVGNFTHLFTPLQAKFRVFKRINDALQYEPKNFPSSFTQVAYGNGQVIQKNAPNLQESADQILIEEYAPAAVLINVKGDILYINGRTGKYLEPAAGKANWNVYVMAKKGLQEFLAINLPKVAREKNKIIQHNIKIGETGSANVVDVTIEWIDKPENIKGTILLVFREPVTDREDNEVDKNMNQAHGNKRIAVLEIELERAREEQQAAMEEMQTSQEELTSSNEELQSTNEELQSANEELTTSHEEMQSLNEELQTVNAELQSKVDELSRTNNDMINLLNSTNIATLFLDNLLNIRRYTTQISAIINLIPGDIGRPVTDLTLNLNYPELVSDATKVLISLTSSDKDISTNNGKWYNVKIMPYQTLESKIDGLVITFTEITRSKKLESDYRNAITVIDRLISSSPYVIFGISPDGRIIEFNETAELFFGKRKEEVFGKQFTREFIPAPFQKDVEELLSNIRSGSVPEKMKWKVKYDRGSYKEIEWSLSSFLDESGKYSGIIACSQEKMEQ